MNIFSSLLLCDHLIHRKENIRTEHFFFIYFKLNIAILVRVIKEMTTIEQVKDSHADQIRLLNNYCTRTRLITTVNNQRDVRDELHSGGCKIDR